MFSSYLAAKPALEAAWIGTGVLSEESTWFESAILRFSIANIN
jgi:hypothetical protein